MLIITGLQAKNRLSKTVVDAKTTVSYPLVKTVTSKDYPVDISENLEEMEDAIRTVADKGGSLLKGPLTKHLNNESRAGYCDKFSPTRWLVIDVDGLLIPNADLKAPVDKYKLRVVAEEIIQHLPEAFHDVSYVAQASSSLGMKGNSVSMHLFFALDAPVKPSALKLYLKHLNLSDPMFESDIELTGSGYSLSWPIDPSVADNSKLIFVAPPVYKDKSLDPFASKDDRIVRVEKDRVQLPISSEIQAVSNVEKMTEKIRKKRGALRKSLGLPDNREKYTTKMFHNERMEVLTNPDQVAIQIVDDTYLPYVRCNVNGGDSQAYYFLITSPEYMRNFKDEPFFSIKAANPKFYEKIKETYGPEVEKHREGQRPVVFRDFYTNKLYNGVFDSDRGEFDAEYPMTVTDYKAVAGFMEAHGFTPPDFIPEARVVFDPKSSETKVNLDVEPYYINQFTPPPHMLNPPKVKPHDIKTVLGLSNVCPNIHTLIHHVVGGEDEDFMRFVNWLAFVYQRREKTGIAWVLGGTQGTGKGVLMHRVLRPLLGNAHVPVKTLESIEEKYNSFLQTALLVGIDEFRINNTVAGSSRLMDKLKNYITEPTISTRAMRSEQIEVPSYSNFVFMTNHADAMKIEEGDRRFSIATPQYEMLKDAHPALIYKLNTLEEELPMFAGFLETFKIDVKLATSAYENDAKKDMKTANMTFREEFVVAMRTGNIGYFQDVLNVSTTDTFNAGRIIEAQNVVRDWAQTLVAGKPMVMTMEKMRSIYTVMTEEPRPPGVREFSRFMSAAGIKTTRQRIINKAGVMQQVSGYSLPAFAGADDIAQDIVDNDDSITNNAKVTKTS